VTAARLLRAPPLLLLLAAAAACAGLALLPGELGPLAARAGLVCLGLGTALLLLRRHAAEPATPRLRVLSRAGLARDASVVLVELDGRPLLLGVGRDGVRLLSDHGWSGPEVEP
jgi:hypothetical protein